MKDLSIRREVSRSVYRIAVPSIGSSIFFMLYSVVDLMWIGRLGKEAIASVTIAMSLYNMNYILNEIFGVASMVMLARRWGEGNLREFERIGRQIVIYKFLAGLVVLGVTFPLAPPLLKWMGGGKVPATDAILYYRWRAVFLPFGFLGGTMMTTFRSIGDTKTLFFISGVWSVTNIVLDPILMFGMKLGVVGAAIASGICETGAMFFGFYMARKKWKVWLLKPEKLQIDILKKVFVLGGPSLLDSINWNVSRLVTVRIFSSIGVLATATYGVFMRVLEIGWMIGFALEGAITTLVGQNLGRKDRERALVVYREGLKIATLWGVILATVVFLFAPQISEIFTSEADLISSSSRFLRVSSFGFFFMLFMNVGYGTLVGGGRTIDTFYIGLLSNWAYRIPLMIIVAKLSKDLNILGAVFASSIAFGALLSVIVVNRKKWLYVEV